MSNILKVLTNIETKLWSEYTLEERDIFISRAGFFPVQSFSAGDWNDCTDPRFYEGLPYRYKIN